MGPAALRSQVQREAGPDLVPGRQDRVVVHLVMAGAHEDRARASDHLDLCRRHVAPVARHLPSSATGLGLFTVVRPLAGRPLHRGAPARWQAAAVAEDSAPSTAAASRPSASWMSFFSTVAAHEVRSPRTAGSTALTAPLGAASGLAPDTALIPASSLSPTHLVQHSPFGGKDLPAERAGFHGRPQGLRQRPGLATRWPAQVPATPLSPTSSGPCRSLSRHGIHQARRPS